MEPNPLKEGLLTQHSTGIGPVSRSMVRERAMELAVIAGRLPQQVHRSDWEQAKRELAGAPESDPNQAVLDAAPETDRWNPVPGSTGQQVPAAAGEDEDAEGRSDNERLVAEGLAGAGHDRMRQAAGPQP